MDFFFASRFIGHYIPCFFFFFHEFSSYADVSLDNNDHSGQANPRVFSALSWLPGVNVTIYINLSLRNSGWSLREDRFGWYPDITRCMLAFISNQHPTNPYPKGSPSFAVSPSFSIFLLASLHIVKISFTFFHFTVWSLNYHIPVGISYMIIKKYSTMMWKLISNYFYVI